MTTSEAVKLFLFLLFMTGAAAIQAADGHTNWAAGTLVFAALVTVTNGARRS